MDEFLVTQITFTSIRSPFRQLSPRIHIWYIWYSIHRTKSQSIAIPHCHHQGHHSASRPGPLWPSGNSQFLPGFPASIPIGSSSGSEGNGGRPSMDGPRFVCMRNSHFRFSWERGICESWVLLAVSLVSFPVCTGRVRVPGPLGRPPAGKSHCSWALRLCFSERLEFSTELMLFLVQLGPTYVSKYKTILTFPVLCVGFL